MKPVFLSHIIDERTPCYGGKSGIVLKNVRSIVSGDSCNEMHWSLGNHTGTHVDAPRHFCQDGKTVDQWGPAHWVFNKVALVRLRGITGGQMIMPDAIGLLSKDAEFVIIKTGYGRLRGRDAYWQNSPGLHPSLAGWLKRKCPGLRAVGMDIISVSSLQHRELGREAHREFLKRGIALVEDMKLSLLKKTPYRVVVAPVRVKDADGAPCTVIAWDR